MARNNSRKQINISGNPYKYPQGYFKDKPCRTCNKYFSPLTPSNLYCSDICKDLAYSNNYYLKQYGLTVKEYYEIFDKQMGLCYICKEQGFKMHEGIKENLVVDHNHKTNKVRGLLCNNCNRGLGLFKDNITNLENAIRYLKNDL